MDAIFIKQSRFQRNNRSTSADRVIQLFGISEQFIITSVTVLFLMNPYRTIPEKTASIVNLCAPLAFVLFTVVVNAVTTTVDFYIFSHCHHPL